MAEKHSDVTERVALDGKPLKGFQAYMRLACQLCGRALKSHPATPKPRECKPVLHSLPFWKIPTYCTGAVRPDSSLLNKAPATFLMMAAWVSTTGANGPIPCIGHSSRAISVPVDRLIF